MTLLDATKAMIAEKEKSYSLRPEVAAFFDAVRYQAEIKERRRKCELKLHKILTWIEVEYWDAADMQELEEEVMKKIDRAKLSMAERGTWISRCGAKIEQLFGDTKSPEMSTEPVGQTDQIVL